MDNKSSWNVVTAADSGELVVAVDFPVTGRPEAGFTDLAANLEPGTPFWQTIPPATMPGSGVSGAEYVRQWDADLAASGRPVRAVLGFCVGCVYAAELATSIAARQAEPPLLVLFDPEQATMTTLRWQFEKMVGNLTGVLTDDEIALSRQGAAELAATAPDVTAFAAELFAAFRAVAEQGLARLGLDAERTAEVMGLFGGFISYLSVADQLDPLPAWRTATALSSTSELSGLNAHRDAGADSELVAQELRIGVEHGRLLGSGEVAETVVKLLRH